MKPEKWKEVLDEIEEWLGDWALVNHNYPRREDCIAAKPHLKPKHIKKAWEEVYGPRNQF